MVEFRQSTVPQNACSSLRFQPFLEGFWDPDDLRLSSAKLLLSSADFLLISANLQLSSANLRLSSANLRFAQIRAFPYVFQRFWQVSGTRIDCA